MPYALLGFLIPNFFARKLINCFVFPIVLAAFVIL